VPRRYARDVVADVLRYRMHSPNVRAAREVVVSSGVEVVVVSGSLDAVTVVEVVLRDVVSDASSAHPPTRRTSIDATTAAWTTLRTSPL